MVLVKRIPTAQEIGKDIILKEKEKEKVVISSRIDKGRKRSGLELPRKILHSSISILVAFVYLSHPTVTGLLRVLSIALFIIISADLLRFNSKPFSRVYNALLGLFMREEEATQVNGVVYYLVGTIFVTAFLPRDIACLSVIILSLCDTAASIFGRLMGKYTPPLPFSGRLFGANKSLAGTLAAALVGCGASYIFWGSLARRGDEGGDVSWMAAREVVEELKWKGVGQVYDWPRLSNLNSTLELSSLVVLCGVIAGVSEAIDVYGLDDNLSLPILFGTFLWISLRILG